ncbi:unnamed protein product [Brassica napus]|uniref:(rape) hypothetical protein n=1 Tax=Brassica napus TaxID=3708 RepID=A0A816VHP0_BRANA|nr:unnamed protein product [Brassica napus]
MSPPEATASLLSLSRFRLSATNRTCPSSSPEEQSQDELEAIKESLKKDASSFLRTCGCFVLSLNSFRDLTVGPCAGGDVKSSSLQIPDELKAHLVNRLRTIGKEKYS